MVSLLGISFLFVFMETARGTVKDWFLSIDLRLNMDYCIFNGLSCKLRDLLFILCIHIINCH